MIITASLMHSSSIFLGVPVSYFMAFLNNFLSFAWKQKELELFLNSPCIFSGSLSPSILCTYQHQEWLQGKTYIKDGNIFVFVITYNNNKGSLEFLSSSIPHCNALVIVKGIISISFLSCPLAKMYHKLLICWINLVF